MSFSLIWFRSILFRFIHLSLGLSGKCIFSAIIITYSKKNNNSLIQLTKTMMLFVYFLPEIVRAMTYVINQGMAMYWGTSRWTAMEIMVRNKELFV